jgi:hypothetical protein
VNANARLQSGCGPIFLIHLRPFPCCCCCCCCCCTVPTVHDAGQNFNSNANSVSNSEFYLMPSNPAAEGARQLPILVHLSESRLFYSLSRRHPSPSISRFSPMSQHQHRDSRHILIRPIHQSDHDPQLHFPSSDACCAQS